MSTPTKAQVTPRRCGAERSGALLVGPSAGNVGAFAGSLAAAAAATPPRSLLKSAGPARRVDASAAKPAEPGSAFKAFASQGLNHFTMFERVASLEAEADALRGEVRSLRIDKQELIEQLRAAQDAMDGVRRSAPADADAGGDGPGGIGADEELVARARAGDTSAHVQLLLQQLAAEQAERRRAHNALVDLRGSVRVYARVRPCMRAGAAEASVAAAPDQRAVSVKVGGATHGFTFSHVFGPAATQPQVYAEVNELTQSALDGCSVCIFSYGQTGSGKTYSMLGDGTGEGRGLVPRTVERILGSVERLKLHDWEYTVDLSVLEIYNERVRDLLDPSAKDVSDINAIKHDAGGHATVAGTKAVAVMSTQQAMDLLAEAAANRASQATAMNTSSSRSHCVMMFLLKGHHARSGTLLTGSLSMVDLAGSERLARSFAEGDRKAETCAINASLSCLADVFDALGAKRSRHVPYRNSKLTYLLKPALSPGGKVLMFVHAAPEEASAYETLTSLRFATKVSGVEVGQATRRVEIAGTPTMGVSGSVQPHQTRSAGREPAMPVLVEGAGSGSVPRVLRSSTKRPLNDVLMSSGSGCLAARQAVSKRSRTWR